MKHCILSNVEINDASLFIWLQTREYSSYLNFFLMEFVFKFFKLESFSVSASNGTCPRVKKPV